VLARLDSGPPGDDNDRAPRRQVSHERETVADLSTHESKRSGKHEAADDHEERDEAERLQALILAEALGRVGQRCSYVKAGLSFSVLKTVRASSRLRQRSASRRLFPSACLRAR